MRASVAHGDVSFARDACESVDRAIEEVGEGLAIEAGGLEAEIDQLRTFIGCLLLP